MSKTTKNSRQLPKEWEVKKLGEVCEVIAGQSPEGKYYNDKGEGLPFYQGKKEFTEKFIGKPTKWTTKITKEAIANDILMSVRAPVGPINFATQKICIGRGLASIRASELVDKDFLFNFLLKHENEIIGNAGAVFNSINKKQIETIEIPIPPLPEQKRIVSLLDRAFEQIDRAKAIAQQNLNNAKEIFESYLNRVFDNGKLLVVNGEWKEKRLGEICEYEKRKNIKTNIPYVGLEHIKSNTGEFIGSLQPQEVKSSTFYFSNEHLLYGRLRPYLNKVLLPNFEGHCSTEIFPIKVNNKYITREYLFYWFFLPKTVDKINATWTGARMPRANMKEVINFKLCIPPLEIQKQIVARLDKLQAETKKLEAVYQNKIANLEELKKSVLERAFRGEL